jgi:hypothetical protein
MENYTTKDIANLFGVSDRAIVKRCKNAKVKMVNGKYLVPQKVLDTWMYKRNAKNQNKSAIRTKTEVPMQVPIEAQVRNISEHQNIALKNKVETLEKELLNYREVLDAHSVIFKRLNDKIENVAITKNENQAKYLTRDAEPILEISTKKTEQEISSGKLRLQAKLEKQFQKAVKHISINKELPNKTAMNEIGFGTRLHHLHKLEDMYPTNSISGSENNETITTISRRNEDGTLETTIDK